MALKGELLLLFLTVILNSIPIVMQQKGQRKQTKPSHPPASSQEQFKSLLEAQD